jgi:glucokinase
MSYALGIDLGGTKVLAGVVNTDTGEVLATALKRTRAANDTGNVVQRMLAVAEEAIAECAMRSHDIVAAGIGVAGQVDTEQGVLIRAPNLPESLAGSHLAEKLEDELHYPVLLVNDVVAAAAGEAGFGAGRGTPDFFCIFVGTGIGGAIYRTGRPYLGATNTAGELGHMVVDYNGRICGCGGRGHLEAYASHTAVVRALLGALRQGRRSALLELEPELNPDEPERSTIRYRAIAEALTQEDALTVEIIEDAARYMGAGLVSIINVYNPPRIVMGGGMVGTMDLFFTRAREHALQQALVVPRREVEIVRAELGENPGIVGAALLAVQQRAAVSR